MNPFDQMSNTVMDVIEKITQILKETYEYQPVCIDPYHEGYVIFFVNPLECTRDQIRRLIELGVTVNPFHKNFVYVYDYYEEYEK